MKSIIDRAQECIDGSGDDMDQFAQALLDAVAKSTLLEERLKEAVEALSGIIEIGKRDMSNPKYDVYFDEARAVLAKLRGEAK